MTIRLLMVDDEPDAQELFRQNFRREIRNEIYHFDFAQSADDAMEILRFGTPPEFLVLLSDINMPGMSGMELLKHARENWPNMGVFMITAYGDTGTQVQVTELGAAAFFTKPVDFVQLKNDLAIAVAQASA